MPTDMSASAKRPRVRWHPARLLPLTLALNPAARLSVTRLQRRRWAAASAARSCLSGAPSQRTCCLRLGQIAMPPYAAPRARRIGSSSRRHPDRVVGRRRNRSRSSSLPRKGGRTGAERGVSASACTAQASSASRRAAGRIRSAVRAEPGRQAAPHAGLLSGRFRSAILDLRGIQRFVFVAARGEQPNEKSRHCHRPKRARARGLTRSADCRSPGDDAARRSSSRTRDRSRPGLAAG